MKVDWDIKKHLDLVDKAMDEAAQEGAEWIAKSAQRQIRRSAKNPTGQLASEIEVVKSKDKGGGYRVEAQGPGNYTRFYASFVELGTKKMDAIPYLRPALKRGRSRVRRLYANKLNAMVT